MKVKIGDKIYSSKDQPIMIHLSNEEKECVCNMADWAHYFCCAPDDTDEDEFMEFMSTDLID